MQIPTIMRKLSFLLFIIFVALFATGADCFAKSRTTPERVIVVPNNGHDKDTGVTPLDEPDVYFDPDEMALRIYGWDNTLASYYVEVEDYYGVTVASETVAGYGWQTVYLDPCTSSGTATVSITTSRGDEYSGTFYVP